jgi:hypothetical protein
LTNHAVSNTRPTKDEHEADPFHSYISRHDTAALLGLSPSGVRNFEKNWLTIKRILGRTTYYHRKQVDDLIMSRKEDKMGLCFTAFREGQEPTAVVAKFGLYAPVVDRCWDQYLAMRRKETSKMVFDVDPAVRSETWLKVHGFEEAPDAAFLRAALEQIARIPELFERCRRASLRARQQREQGSAHEE